MEVATNIPGLSAHPGSGTGIAPGSGGHVCIVDDDLEVRSLLAAYLTRHGMRVGAFADGASLRRFLARGNPDLVILDLMLPVEDGLSLCRRPPDCTAYGRPWRR